jgi:protein-S-isoprenylcysteine O-methyltransferase Ste14
MKRWLVFVYGVVSYVIFLGVFVYAFGFVGNVLVPKAMDSPAEGPFGTALAVNLGLLTVFALQHSGMARRGFKRWLTRFVPEPAERSTYVLLSSAALILLFAFWRPLGGVVWHVESTVGQILLYALFTSGFLLVLVTTFLIDHFDLFGLRQVWLYLRGRAYTPTGFRTPGLYKVVRHPLYVGWFLAFWATPTMTAAHLLFAFATTAYILVAIQLEERDLVAAFGPTYAEYRRRVPMLLPRLGRARSRQATGTATPRTA